jgi:hypothetical protein
MGQRPTQCNEERSWRELQLAASASAGGRAANFGMFFNGVPIGLRPTQGHEERWWRELQLAASGFSRRSRGEFGIFFN